MSWSTAVFLRAVLRRPVSRMTFARHRESRRVAKHAGLSHHRDQVFELRWPATRSWPPQRTSRRFSETTGPSLPANGLRLHPLADSLSQHRMTPCAGNPQRPVTDGDAV